MKIALISCSKTKHKYRCPAKELYSASTLFFVSYQYAKALNVDKIYILSAKHGLIHEDQEITPYDFSMDNLPENRRIDWANYVKEQIATTLDPINDEFIILTGMTYLRPLQQVKAINKYWFPLRGMDRDRRVNFMKNETQILQSQIAGTDDYCDILHQMLSQQKTYRYDEISEISFNNGIYIIFENDELYKKYNRIVRVGTHISPDRLKARLRDHYIAKNKDGSIFRKNIGKAILNKRQDIYLNIWSKDTSRQENQHLINAGLQNDIENEVSEYLQQNTFFTVFKIENKAARLRLEEGIIATVNKGVDFIKSTNWLGNYSTEFEIRNSGMWLKKGLNKPILTAREMDVIKSALNTNGNNNNFEQLWLKILKYQGEKFYTKTGLEFVYKVENNHLQTTRTEWQIPKDDFEQASQIPNLKGPGQINNHVNGPSYVFAILTDSRIMIP